MGSLIKTPLEQQLEYALHALDYEFGPPEYRKNIIVGSAVDNALSHRDLSLDDTENLPECCDKAFLKRLKEDELHFWPKIREKYGDHDAYPIRRRYARGHCVDIIHEVVVSGESKFFDISDEELESLIGELIKAPDTIVRKSGGVFSNDVGPLKDQIRVNAFISDTTVYGCVLNISYCRKRCCILQDIAKEHFNERMLPPLSLNFFNCDDFNEVVRRVVDKIKQYQEAV